MNKNFYNTVLCQAFSPCGNLIIGDIFGAISIFPLKKVLNPEISLSKSELLPKSKIVVKENFQINSLVSTQSHLLVGTVGEIVAYTWRNVNCGKNIQAWSIEIPNNKDDFEKGDINSLLLEDDGRKLIAACSEVVYVIDLETRRILKSLEKHSDYIHCLCTINNELISGGEDGLVNIWDMKSYKIINKIIPNENQSISRPNLGKWIGAVSCNEDYILCGGGPRLSLWHYRFMNNSTIFPIGDNGIHVAEIYKDNILAGGRCQFFYQMSYVGNIITEIPTSAVTTYSVIHQEEPFKVMSIAGSSPRIDICSNFMYKDLQLSLYY